ncbi:lipopolysaccharide biosynthesis protein [Microbacterium sp. MAHUQ-60]|uniref:lipopolysaccharide biosynthesis protein n=1 Tax=unclassified Microbacterium TaxID=2609290 RepID=UPI0036100C46
MTGNPGNSGLASQAASSVAWLTAQTWLAKAGGFVTVVLLARLLSPSDFGLVAVAMTVVPVVYLIADLGFATYLVQVKEIKGHVASTAFWYSALSGLMLSVLLVASAPLLESLFGVPGVAGVISAMAPAVIFVSLAAVPIALLRRGMRFRALSIQAAVAALVGQIVAIAMAVSGAGVWALVAQVVVAQVVTMIAAWVAARWRPSRAFDWTQFRTMFSFGSKVVGVNAIAMGRQWAENAIISNVLGAAALGQLTVAQRLVQTGQEIAGAAITPVSTVVFAQVREDRGRLRRGYDRALGLSYLVIAPALTAILVTAPVLVPFLFGPQWTHSVGAAQALSVAALFTLAATLDHGLFYGLGRPGMWLVYATVTDVVTVIVTAVLARHGIVAITTGFAVVAAVATIVRIILVARVIGASVWIGVRRILAAMTAMGASALAGWGTLVLLPEMPSILVILIVGAAVLIVHLCVARLLLPAAFRDVVHELRSRIRRHERGVMK